jgi:hypothetical protein
MNRFARRPFSRDQRTTIIYGMLVFVLIIVVLQPETLLGDDERMAWR